MRFLKINLNLQIIQLITINNEITFMARTKAIEKSQLIRLIKDIVLICPGIISAAFGLKGFLIPK